MICWHFSMQSFDHISLVSTKGFNVWVKLSNPRCLDYLAMHCSSQFIATIKFALGQNRFSLNLGQCNFCWKLIVVGRAEGLSGYRRFIVMKWKWIVLYPVWPKDLWSLFVKQTNYPDVEQRSSEPYPPLPVLQFVAHLLHFVATFLFCCLFLCLLKALFMDLSKNPGQTDSTESTDSVWIWANAIFVENWLLSAELKVCLDTEDSL